MNEFSPGKRRVFETLRRVDDLVAAGASLAGIARGLGVPESTLIALAESYLTGRRGHGRSAALDHTAKALGVSREQAMARVLSAAFEG